MTIQEKILKTYQDNDFTQMIAIYQQNSQTPLKNSTLIIIAIIYHVQQQYQKTLKTLQKIKSTNNGILYQVKMLQFKSKYLSGKSIQQQIKQLEQLVKLNGFNENHKKCVQQFKNVIKSQTQIVQKNLQQLKQQSDAYKKILNRQLQINSIAFLGFPVYLISKKWYSQWKSYVHFDQESKNINKSNPGCISQFQILANQYNVIEDPNPQKEYTNKYLVPTTNYQILTKQCWTFLQQRYGGIAIPRINLTDYNKLNQTFTEIFLKKLIIFKYTNQNQKFYIQISRRQSWKKLQNKIIGIWGYGTIFLFKKGQKKYITTPNSSLQQLQIAFDSLIGFQQLDQKKPTIKNKQKYLSRCGHCTKTQSLKFCQCKLIKYCNLECLKNHRTKHRKQCQTKKESDYQMNQLLSKNNLQQVKTFAGRKGLVGLRNLGNTCFMNSGIQCLSNTKQITKYFLSNTFLNDINSNNPLGSGGLLACSYAKLIRQIWSGNEDQISPSQLKKIIGKFSPQFSGYSQHDSQQLISSLIDGLHQDTNLIKVKQNTVADQQFREDQQASKISEQNYGKRNKSFISDLITGQFKSKLVCPKCNKISIIFDPFMIVSLPIPQNKQIQIFYVNLKLDESAIKLTIIFKISDKISDIIQKIGQQFNIDSKNLIFISLDDNYLPTKIFNTNDSVDAIVYQYSIKRNHIFCYETQPQSPLKIKYTITYNVVRKGKIEIGGYQRYAYLQANPKQQIVQELIYNGVSKFLKDKKQSIKSIFQFQIIKSNINVTVKSNQIKLCTYKDPKKQINTRTTNSQISLYDCLDQFTKQQKLDKDNFWYCNKCKQHVDATKKMDIYKANKILVLGFKRFKGFKKIKNNINFPIKNLNLSKYILSNLKLNESINYQLYAVSNHYGTMSGGHYTAYCKNFLNNKWYQFNDNRVSKINQQEVITGNAYVLFYRKIQ